MRVCLDSLKFNNTFKQLAVVYKFYIIDFLGFHLFRKHFSIELSERRYAKKLACFCVK